MPGSFLFLVLYWSSLIIRSETERNSGNVCLPFSTSSYKRWDGVWVKVKAVKMILRRSDDRMKTREQRWIWDGGIAPQNKVKWRLSQNNYPFISGEQDEWWEKWTKRTRNEERINKGRKNGEALTSQQIIDVPQSFCSASMLKRFGNKIYRDGA